MRLANHSETLKFNDTLISESLRFKIERSYFIWRHKNTKLEHFWHKVLFLKVVFCFNYLSESKNWYLTVFDNWNQVKLEVKSQYKNSLLQKNLFNLNCQKYCLPQNYFTITKTVMITFVYIKKWDKVTEETTIPDLRGHGSVRRWKSGPKVR